MVTQTNSRQEGDVQIFEISGRLSLGNTLMSVENSLKQLVQGGAKKLVIDVSSLTAIDSAGVGTLVMIAGEIGEAGGKLKIAGASGLVQRTFDIVHLDRVIEQQPDVATAVRAFASQAAGV